MPMHDGMMGENGADKPSDGIMGGGMMEQAHEMMSQMSPDQMRQLMQFMQQLMEGGAGPESPEAGPSMEALKSAIQGR